MGAGVAIQTCLIHMIIDLHQKHHSSCSLGICRISINCKDNQNTDPYFQMSAHHFFLDVPQVHHTQMFKMKLTSSRKVVPLLYSTSQWIRSLSPNETSKPFLTLPSSPPPNQVKTVHSYAECLLASSLAHHSHFLALIHILLSHCHNAHLDFWTSDTSNSNPSSHCYLNYKYHWIMLKTTLSKISYIVPNIKVQAILFSKSMLQNIILNTPW